MGGVPRWKCHFYFYGTGPCCTGTIRNTETCGRQSVPHNSEEQAVQMGNSIPSASSSICTHLANRAKVTFHRCHAVATRCSLLHCECGLRVTPTLPLLCRFSASTLCGHREGRARFQGEVN